MTRPVTGVSAKDFCFANGRGTDFPSYDVWYVWSGKLTDAQSSIKLADDSEHEYELKTVKHKNIVIGWGTPEGLFHMYVDSNGKFVRSNGLPSDLANPNTYATELRWSGSEFVNQDGTPLPSNVFQDKVVRVPRLAHIYLSGCEPNTDFGSSSHFPGAIIPNFSQSPTLRCGLREEDESVEIKVESAP